jgi:hypothetical protein
MGAAESNAVDASYPTNDEDDYDFDESDDDE